MLPKSASPESTVFSLRNSFNAFCAERHIGNGHPHLAPNEFTALLRETAVNIWLSEAQQSEVMDVPEVHVSGVGT